MKLDDFLISLVVGLFLYGLLKGRIEEKKRDKEYAAKHIELAQIRNGELKKRLPNHMAIAFEKFKADYQKDTNSFGSMNEFSPLACFGYRVGKTKGAPELIRREIIYHTWYATLPDIIPDSYAKAWGNPGTYQRYSRIISHLSMLASQRRDRKNYGAAVSDWEADLEWFKQNYSILAESYKRHGFRK